MPRRSKIFLSYRRGDTAGHTGRLHEDLVRVFGASRVFLDIEGLKPGDDFVSVLRQRLDESAVVIVAIGTRWAGVNHDGSRRIDDENDFVRLEVANALIDPKVRVIPVLCDGARMPTESELPAPLAPLSRRQSFELSDLRWRQDIHALFDTVRTVVPEAGRSKRVLTRAFAWLAFVAIVGTGLVFGGRELVARFTADAESPGNQARRAEPELDPRSANFRSPSPRADSRMPSPPAERTVPANIVASAAAQLARARREWVSDAIISSIDINCDAGRTNSCPVRIRMHSASKFASLDASQASPDSAWSYRQGGGSNNDEPLSLEIVELSRVVSGLRTSGITSEIDRVTLAHASLQNGSKVPRWTIFLRNRQQAGREGRICVEPRSGERADCRSGGRFER